jgi:hypothetical protein
MKFFGVVSLSLFVSGGSAPCHRQGTKTTHPKTFQK